MKTKRFEKKLVLNKKIIANLNNQEMNAVQGGIDTTPTAWTACNNGATCRFPCVTWQTACCAIT